MTQPARASSGTCVNLQHLVELIRSNDRHNEMIKVEVTPGFDHGKKCFRYVLWAYPGREDLHDAGEPLTAIELLDEAAVDKAKRQAAQQPPGTETYVPVLAALDRCEHGRHKADSCVSCPAGRSSGNLFLEPGTRIGTDLYGQPIGAPDHDIRGISENWVPQGRVK